MRGLHRIELLGLLGALAFSLTSGPPGCAEQPVPEATCGKLAIRDADMTATVGLASLPNDGPQDFDVSLATADGSSEAAVQVNGDRSVGIAARVASNTGVTAEARGVVQIEYTCWGSPGVGANVETPFIALVPSAGGGGGIAVSGACGEEPDTALGVNSGASRVELPFASDGEVCRITADFAVGTNTSDPLIATANPTLKPNDLDGDGVGDTADADLVDPTITNAPNDPKELGEGEVSVDPLAQALDPAASLEDKAVTVRTLDTLDVASAATRDQGLEAADDPIPVDTSDCDGVATDCKVVYPFDTNLEEYAAGLCVQAEGEDLAPTCNRVLTGEQVDAVRADVAASGTPTGAPYSGVAGSVRVFTQVALQALSAALGVDLSDRGVVILRFRDRLGGVPASISYSFDPLVDSKGEWFYPDGAGGLVPALPATPLPTSTLIFVPGRFRDDDGDGVQGPGEALSTFQSVTVESDTARWRTQFQAMPGSVVLDEPPQDVFCNSFSFPCTGPDQLCAPTAVDEGGFGVDFECQTVLETGCAVGTACGDGKFCVEFYDGGDTITTCAQVPPIEEASPCFFGTQQPGFYCTSEGVPYVTGECARDDGAGQEVECSSPGLGDPACEPGETCFFAASDRLYCTAQPGEGCLDGQDQCQSDHFCTDSPAGGLSVGIPIGCGDTADCPGSFECLGGRCIEGVACDPDAPLVCGADQLCLEPVEGEGRCFDVDADADCVLDSDCASLGDDYRCEPGILTGPLDGLDAVGVCDSAADCIEDSECATGLCLATAAGGECYRAGTMICEPDTVGLCLTACEEVEGPAVVRRAACVRPAE